MGRSKRLLFLAFVAAAPALACNAILGIDDFKRTECGAEVCPFDGGEDQFVPDQFVPDAGKDSQPDAPPGAAAVSWARFPMPNYKADSGVVVFDPRPLQYDTTTNPGIVEDKVTGLVWQKKLVEDGLRDFYYPAAKSECQKIAGGDWRLPKRIELVTLLSHGGTQPFIDRSAFAVPDNIAAVWTSSEVRTSNGPEPDKYWAVDFSTGAVTKLNGKDGGFAAKVLCIRDQK